MEVILVRGLGSSSRGGSTSSLQALKYEPVLIGFVIDLIRESF